VFLPPQWGVAMHPHWAFARFIASLHAADVLIQMDLFPGTVLQMIRMAIGASLHVALQISFYL